MSIRIGFIGVGGIAADHLINLLHIPEVEVIALCDLSLDRIQTTLQMVNQRLALAVSRSPGSPENARIDRLLDAVPYHDYQPMLRNEHLDAVYICLPPFAHGDPEEAVIASGLPMLVEKPVALDLSTAARILQGIRRKGLMAASGYQTRYTTHLQRAHELLSGRTIGMVVATRFGQTPTTNWYHLCMPRRQPGSTTPSSRSTISSMSIV
jgi:myo-inositol 2-dehydrogenase/D-chiro-inositol 1-dehydrogenase